MLDSELRASARLLLSHEALGIDDRVTQRVLANAAATEALERELRDADSIMAATLMAAARRAVEHERRASGIHLGSGHLAPGILVSMALVPQVLATSSRKAAEEHMQACADCTDHAKRVREAATDVIQEQEGDPEAPTGPIERSVMGVPTRSTASLGAIVPERGSGGDASEAAEAMLQRMLREADAVAAGQQAEPRGTSPRARRRRRRGAKGEPQLKAWPLALALVVLGCLVFRMEPGCEREQPALAPDPTLMGMAIRDLPPLPPRHERVEELGPGFKDLEAGDCAMAAKRFHLARLRSADQAEAWYWEGAASLCAGEGDQAVQALLMAGGLDPQATDLVWYTSQAALLSGNRELSEQWLRKSCGSRSRYVREACAQLARLGPR